MERDTSARQGALSGVTPEEVMPSQNMLNSGSILEIPIDTREQYVGVNGCRQFTV